MNMLKNTPIALLALGTLIASALVASPASADLFKIQAEDGRIDNAGCGDDGPMETRFAQGALVVFHPGSGCSQTFSQLSPVASVTAIRYFTSGVAGEICGHFVISGLVSSSTPRLCSPNDTWTVAFFNANVRGATYAITWVADAPSPPWVNAWVDYHLGN